MTRTLASLICLVTLLSAAPASANTSDWVEGRLVKLLDHAGSVERQGRWLTDSRTLYSGFAAGRLESGKTGLFAARLTSTRAAHEVLAQLRAQEQRLGGDFRALSAKETGFRFRRRLSGGRALFTVVLAEGEHLYRVDVALQRSASKHAKPLLKESLSAIKTMVATGSLPSPTGAKRVKSSQHLWQVRNQTRGAMVVSVRTERGKTYTWRLAAGEVKLLRVAPGKNFVTVTSELPNVNPFVGWERQDKGRYQASRFYIG